ncbi:MAG: NAD(P)H-dependent oxidoreductase [Nakamurella sp.]
MTTLKIILGSTRPGSSAPAIGRWLTAAAAQTTDFAEIEILDLAAINLPFLDEPIHPKLGQYTKPHTFAWSRAVDSADALIIVMPEYNAGFPAPLKNALDFLHAEWADKPLGVVSYGGGGGARAAALLRPVTNQLGLVCTEHAVALRGAAGRVIDDEFVASDADTEAAAIMLAELTELDAELSPRRQPALAS